MRLLLVMLVMLPLSSPTPQVCALANGCPEDKPHKYPGFTRCFATPTYDPPRCDFGDTADAAHPACTFPCPEVPCPEVPYIPSSAACPEVPYVDGSPCDWQCYLDRYSELGATLGADNIEAAATHYKCSGHAEGRDCTCGQSESLAVHINPSLIISHSPLLTVSVALRSFTLRALILCLTLCCSHNVLSLTQ